MWGVKTHRLKFANPFLTSLADDIGTVNTSDFCKKVEQDACEEESNPLGVASPLGNPIHRQEEETH